MGVTFAGGYKDDEGRFHPIQPKAHSGVASKIGEEKPESKLSQHFGSMKIIGQKIHSAGKKANQKRVEHQDKKKDERENIELQLDDILYDDNISDLKKFQMMQPIISKNQRVLGKENLVIYNKRLVELHERIKSSPENSRMAVNNHHSPRPTRNEDNSNTERPNRPTADDMAINRAHDAMLKTKERNDLREEIEKLSPEQKAETIFAGL